MAGFFPKHNFMTGYCLNSKNRSLRLGFVFCKLTKVFFTIQYMDTKKLQETLKRELWSEAVVWMQERAQTLLDGGHLDEAAALYSEFARGPALCK